MTSIVIPTFNESKNIEAMLRRTAKVLREAGEKYELIVVDDNSPDGTADLAEALKDSCSVRVVRRSGRLGLATAVLDGWAAAKGDLLGVIDADLQHPPEVLVALARALRNLNAQVAVASRKVPGGGMKEWSRVRQFISWGSTRLAYVLLGEALWGTTDPLSGIFMVKADVVRGRQMRPLGYKILLEVLARGEYSKVTDVPYIFESRTEGESKLGPRQSWEYLAPVFRWVLRGSLLGRWITISAINPRRSFLLLILGLRLLPRTGMPGPPAWRSTCSAVAAPGFTCRLVLGSLKPARANFPSKMPSTGWGPPLCRSIPVSVSTLVTA